MPDLPKTPTHLSPNARRLWARTVAEYDLAYHELLVLEQACRELTLIERMEADILALKKLTVRGSMGQPVISEHVKEIRQHRAAFERSLKALNLPADADAPAGTRATQAREAAAARWRMTG